MLPPFIIEQIRKREEDSVPAQPLIELELPLGPGPRPRPRKADEDDEGQRGVVIIEL